MTTAAVHVRDVRRPGGLLCGCDKTRWKSAMFTSVRQLCDKVTCKACRAAAARLAPDLKCEATDG